MPSVSFKFYKASWWAISHESLVTTSYLTESKLTVGSADSGFMPVSCVGTILFSILVAQISNIVKAITFDSKM